MKYLTETSDWKEMKQLILDSGNAMRDRKICTLLIDSENVYKKPNFEINEKIIQGHTKSTAQPDNRKPPKEGAPI